MMDAASKSRNTVTGEWISGSAIGTLARKLGFPANYGLHVRLLLPLIVSLVLQRAYHIVDNRFVNELGTQALLIHNVQYNFIVLGMFLGSATATSSLVFWRRAECLGRQGSIFLKHVLLTFFVAATFAVSFWALMPHVIDHFGISPEYRSFSSTYIAIGLLNMVLQGLYAGMDGMLVASGQQKKSMIYSTLLVCGNVVANGIAIFWFFDRNVTAAEAIFTPLLIIGVSTTLLSFAVLALAVRSVIQKIDGWEAYAFKDVWTVWKGEAGIAVLRAFSPLIYAYQLGMLQGSGGFIVTYNLVLHLAYVFCLPLTAGMQIAIRDAAHDQSVKDDLEHPSWLRVLAYTAFLPTVVLLFLGMLLPSQFIRLFYDFATPVDHVPFVAVFFFACLIGQLGHIVAIPIRAQKKSTLITRNILIAEYGFLLGGTQLLIFLDLAKPATICWATIAFCVGFLGLNVGTMERIRKNYKREKIHNNVEVTI